jgi:hypothetical protein
MVLGHLQIAVSLTSTAIKNMIQLNVWALRFLSLIP